MLSLSTSYVCCNASEVYQHCSEKHLHRYLAEFDFRYSNRVRLGIGDVERTQRDGRKAADLSKS